MPKKDSLKKFIKKKIDSNAQKLIQKYTWLLLKKKNTRKLCGEHESVLFNAKYKIESNTKFFQNNNFYFE